MSVLLLEEVRKLRYEMDTLKKKNDRCMNIGIIDVNE
jgi:hypothetical protein